MMLSRVWLNGSQRLEADLKRGNHFDQLCSVCIADAVGKAFVGSEK